MMTLELLNVLDHSSKCSSAYCTLSYCRYMRQLSKHFFTCNKFPCKICKDMSNLTEVHASNCVEERCAVVKCSTFKLVLLNLSFVQLSYVCFFYEICFYFLFIGILSYSLTSMQRRKTNADFLLGSRQSEIELIMPTIILKILVVNKVSLLLEAAI